LVRFYLVMLNVVFRAWTEAWLHWHGTVDQSLGCDDRWSVADHC